MGCVISNTNFNTTIKTKQRFKEVITIENLQNELSKLSKINTDLTIQISNNSINSKCPICFINKREISYIHTDVAHLVCCSECFEKIKDTKCPICNIDARYTIKTITV